MTQEDYEGIIFGLISHAGEAKALAFDALNAANAGEFEKSDELLKQSDDEFLEAHKIQTDIIQREGGGEKIDITVLFVHAQDHLMTGLTERNLIEGMIKLIKRLDALEKNK